MANNILKAILITAILSQAVLIGMSIQQISRGVSVETNAVCIGVNVFMGVLNLRNLFGIIFH